MKIEIKGTGLTVYEDMAAMRNQGVPFCLPPLAGINGWRSSKRHLQFRKKWLTAFGYNHDCANCILIRERDFSLVKMIASCAITVMA